MNEPDDFFFSSILSLAVLLDLTLPESVSIALTAPEHP